MPDLNLVQSAINLLQRAKHRSQPAVWSMGLHPTQLRSRGWEAAATLADRLSPVAFDEGRYHREFVMRSAPDDDELSILPERIFALWTGDNALTVNRRRGLAALEERAGVPVVLVTPDSLSRWIVPSHPIHPAYEHLSLTHRSDYLRAYLLHHHGGGYADIKSPTSSWLGTFKAMQANEGIWVAGYREMSAAEVLPVSGRLGRDLALSIRRLVGQGALVARSHTPLTGEWLREVERLLDYYEPHLKEIPGGISNEVAGYPIPWTRIMAQVFHPIQFKYLNHVRVDDALRPVFENYR